MSNRRFYTLLGSILLVAAITSGHYLTPPSHPQMHHAMDRLYYLPIVLVGLRCGALAGAGLGVFVALVYFPHLFTHFGGDPLGADLGRTFEMLMWVLIGFLTGLLSDRERAARRQAEDARDAAEQSAEAAREATRDLLEAQEQMRSLDRLATIGLLSASLAHEVRNPLASLKGIADLLRRDVPAGNPRRELVDIIDEEVRRLDGVVGAYLEQAKSPRGVGPASIERGIRTVEALLAAEARKRHVHLEVSVDPPDLFLPMPQGLLQQVLLNLCMNSLQAMHDSGGAVRISAWRNGDANVLSVADTGRGFPREIMDGGARAFMTTREQGTGLGLPIARGIVERHGGTFALENPPEGGARVILTFPRSDSA